jgi:hypothetical protein
MITTLNHQIKKTPMNLFNPNNNTDKIKVLLIVMVLALVCSYQADAQRFSRNGRNVKRGAKMNIGVEASMGTRAFHLKSDIIAIDKMSVPVEGGNFGVIAGNKFYRIKIKQGYFNSAPAVPQKFQMIETKGILNLYLLQSLLKTRPKYFEPYFITAVDRSMVKFYGSYVDKSKLNGGNNTSGTSTSGHGTSGTSSGSNTGAPVLQCGGPMGDPDETGTTPTTTPPTDPTTESPDQTSQDPTLNDPTRKDFLGKISTMHANVGLGLECHIPGQKHFVNLFAEAQYGFPFSTSTKDIPFNNTKVSGVFSVNFGLSFGITR